MYEMLYKIVKVTLFINTVKSLQVKLKKKTKLRGL
jgi:hypothetical protein